MGIYVQRHIDPVLVFRIPVRITVLTCDVTTESELGNMVLRLSSHIPAMSRQGDMVLWRDERCT